MSASALERRNMLKAYLDGFEMKNRRAINNGVHVSQQIKIVSKVYEDFQGFGRLGVSSFRLNWDYSILNGKSRGLVHEQTVLAKNFEKAARLLSKYSNDEIRLMSCLLWKNGKILSAQEKESANKIVKRLKKDL